LILALAVASIARERARLASQQMARSGEWHEAAQYPLSLGALRAASRFAKVARAPNFQRL
jgi:hypothetical protein